MNTESIRGLAEAHKKANEIIQQARKEKEVLEKESIKKAQEYEQKLIATKEAEVKKYFQQANIELANTEQSIINQVKQTIADLREKDEEVNEIANIIASVVMGQP